MGDQDGLDENGFPEYPEIRPLPPLRSKNERLKFVFSLIEKHGEDLADYIFAQFRHASTPEEMVRWDLLSQMAEEVLGHPLAVSYDVEARLAAEGVRVNIEEEKGDGKERIARLPKC